MSEIYRFLGRVLMAQGKPGEAVPLYRRAIDELQQAIGPDGPELTPAVHELGRALWRSGDKGEAQTTLARAVKLMTKAFEDPALVRTTLGSGKTPADELSKSVFKAGCEDEWLLYQGEFEAAAKGFSGVIEFEEREQQVIPDPEGMPAWELMAEAEAGLGRWDAAVEAYLRAAEQWEQRLCPGHPRAQQCRHAAATLASRRAA